MATLTTNQAALGGDKEQRKNKNSSQEGAILLARK
jgi:hypothetical protein